MDAEYASEEVDYKNRPLIGKELIFFRSEYLLKSVKIPDSVKLESPVQVTPDYYEQFARTRPVREFDDTIVHDAPTIKISEKRSIKKDGGKKKGRSESLQANENEISVEIQRLFLKHKIAF